VENLGLTPKKTSTVGSEGREEKTRAAEEAHAGHSAVQGSMEMMT